MIVITLDGLRWDTAEKYLKNIFQKQSMRMIKNNVQYYTNEPGKGQPTTVGLVTLWSGLKPNQFHENLMHHIDPIYNKNMPYEFFDKDGKPMDLIWNYFNKRYFLCNAWGPNPMLNGELFFTHMNNLPAERRPSDELGFWRDIATLDYDLYWFHCTYLEYGYIKHGPYQQGLNPVVKEYKDWRHDKPFKKQVHEFAIKRFKFMINMLNDMTDDVVVITSDHGTGLDNQIKQEDLDEIPVIVNRDVDLSDINYQWDMKKLLLRLKDEK